MWQYAAAPGDLTVGKYYPPTIPPQAPVRGFSENATAINACEAAFHDSIGFNFTKRKNPAIWSVGPQCLRRQTPCTVFADTAAANRSDTRSLKTQSLPLPIPLK